MELRQLNGMATTHVRHTAFLKVGHSYITWQGLTDLEMVRMKAAADQLLATSSGANQWPSRDFASFHLLYATAMRVNGFIRLEFDEYDGKYLINVQRKGKTVTPEIFLVKSVHDALDDYISEERGDKPGPLIQTRTVRSLSIQQVDYLLKRIAGQASRHLGDKEQIQVHPHILRHTAQEGSRRKGCRIRD